MKKGKIRGFGALIGLSIVTLGIYLLYWLYINLKEINESFVFEEKETVLKTAKHLFIFYVIFSVLSTIISLALTDGPSFKLNPIVIFFSLISAGIGLAFFYYFTSSVALAQTKAQIEPFDIPDIYGSYFGGIVPSFFSGIVATISFAFGGILGLIGIAVIIIFFYKLLEEINQIWSDGVFEENSAV